MFNVRHHVKYDPDVVYDNESRAFTRGVRLVCGGAFGLVPGLWIVIHLYPIDAGAVALVLIASVATCAALAAYCGDRFWHAIGQVVRSGPFF